MVVGVSAYQDKAYRLTYADKDANDLADYLQTRKENFNQVRLVRLVNQDATRDNITKAKRLLRGVESGRPGDRLLCRPRAA